MRIRKLSLFVVTVALVAVAAPIAIGAATAAKNVKVGDDYFSVHKLTIKKGGKVKWSWSANNIEPHNVTLLKGPHGVKLRNFKSKTRVSGLTFLRTFSTPGTYHFQCTIHPDFMNMTIVVKR